MQIKKMFTQSFLLIWFVVTCSNFTSKCPEEAIEAVHRK
jgi:hypothetical protein